MLKQLFMAIRHSWVVGAPVSQKPHPLSSSGELCLDPKACTDCRACVKACPAQALRETSESERGLFFFPARCIACVRCLEACPSKALSFKPGSGFLATQAEEVKCLKSSGSQEGKPS